MLSFREGFADELEKVAEEQQGLTTGQKVGLGVGIPLGLAAVGTGGYFLGRHLINRSRMAASAADQAMRRTSANTAAAANMEMSQVMRNREFRRQLSDSLTNFDARLQRTATDAGLDRLQQFRTGVGTDAAMKALGSDVKRDVVANPDLVRKFVDNGSAEDWLKREVAKVQQQSKVMGVPVPSPEQATTYLRTGRVW